MAHMACTRYTERPNLRCWLSALRSTLFICHFRYNACRHAASTSMYAQVLHPWRTRPVRVIPKGRSCASGCLLFAVLCVSATFDTTLAGTQQVHPCMLRCAIRGAHGLYALYRKAELALLALSTSQYFVYLPLSIQRSQARSKYIHVCSGAPSLAHKACMRYTERPIYAAGFLLFAVLCLSGTFDTTIAGMQQVLPCMFSCAIRGAHGQYALYRKAELALLALSTSQYFVYLRLSATFDTTLAGTQQVHPCMLSCAIRGAHGLYALYRKADLRCWLPALRSPLFICHFRYNARRHAASTSMYAQVRHPWRTWPVRVIPKGRFTLLASCSSQSFVYLALSIQRSQARSKYFHVCSAAPSVAHMACTRYTERRTCGAGFLLFAVLCLSGTFDTTLAGTQQVLPCMFSCAIPGAQG